MGFSGFIRGVVLILMASSFVRPLMADPRANVVVLAYNSWKAVNATIYAKNSVIALVNQSSLVDQNGFGAVVAGEAPNAVFGLAQCYKDLSFTDCKLCYSEIRTTIAKCFPKMGGRVFLDGCFSRYENYSFFNQGIDSVNLRNCSLNKNNYPPDKFKEVIRKVIGSLRLASKRSKGFAAGSDSISNLRVYALAQCWETLGEKACDSCLQAATSSIMSCSPSVEGRSPCWLLHEILNTAFLEFEPDHNTFVRNTQELTDHTRFSSCWVPSPDSDWLLESKGILGQIIL